MKQFQYTFTTVEELVTFAERAERCNYDVDVCYNHIVIDGKSLMGIMNIGIGKKVDIVCHSEDASIEALVATKAA